MTLKYFLAAYLCIFTYSNYMFIEKIVFFLNIKAISLSIDIFIFDIIISFESEIVSILNNEDFSTRSSYAKKITHIYR